MRSTSSLRPSSLGFGLPGLTLVVSACTSTTASTTTTVPETTTTTATPDPGRLVVGYRDGHSAILDEGGKLLVEMPLESDNRQRAPVWLGSDAVVAAEGSPDAASLVAFSAADGATVWKVEFDTLPFYYSPAPVGDPPSVTSLRNDPGGDGLIAELLDSSGGVSPLSRRSPFYTAWSPDGSSLAIHSGQATLDVRTPDATSEIVATTGAFQAPAWTTAGLLTLRTVDDAQRLSVWNGTEFSDVTDVPSSAQFVASGSKIALQMAAPEVEGGVRTRALAQSRMSVPTGVLVVIDLDLGEVDIVHNDVSPVFQWDPSGTRLLYATFGDNDPLDMSWHVWEAGSSTVVAEFTPQADWIRSVVPFADQFMQSVTLWSPDGKRVAYPATVDGRQVVVVLELDGTETVIDDAIWVSWSS